ncbi:MAG: hypothetical protein K9N62_19200 [Verrucomicrobia bacterium]|jgi:hypothetical protein|nr:hypothetical protein [Verrucomicrobiota bacterium]
MVDSKAGVDQQAIEKLQQVRDRFPGEFTESGLRLASLADLCLLEISLPWGPREVRAPIASMLLMA